MTRHSVFRSRSWASATGALEVCAEAGPTTIIAVATASSEGQAYEISFRATAIGGQSSLIWDGGEASLPPGETTMGRGAGVSLRIDDSSLSRRHARITVSEAEVVLDDLGGKNGTFLGDSRVTASRELTDGNEIRLGGVHLVFRQPGIDASTTTLAGALESKGSAVPKTIGISRRKAGKEPHS